MLNGFLSASVLRLFAFSQRGGEYLRRRTKAGRSAKQIREAFYEKAWREAAEALGADFSVLGEKIHQITLGQKRTNVFCNYTELDGPITLRLAGDKAIVSRLLRRHGLPTPRAVEFSLKTLSRAREFLKKCPGPCVIKPARNSSAGRGVTTGVLRPSHLRRASIAAAAFSRNLLIEEQVPGNNYRLLFLDGELLDAVHRQSPSLVGDGKSTVRELVRRANAERLAGGARAAQALLASDEDMQRTLAGQGLGMNSIPQRGQRVSLKTVINDNAANENQPARDLICESIVEQARRAVAAIGGRFVGVDIITKDPTRPLSETGGVILELNTTPGFYYHSARPHDPVPVALYVLASIFGLSAPLLTNAVDSQFEPAEPPRTASR